MVKNNPIPVNELQGAYVAIITPMNKTEGICKGIDYAKFFKLIDDLIANGVSGIVVAGTTGQSATLGHSEQVDLITNAFTHINGRTKLIASAGSNSTSEAIELSKIIEKEIGPTTLLHVTGYYNNPPQEGLIEHYLRIADAIDGNIILYNVPGRTKSNIEAGTAIELSKHLKIIGLKEASGDEKQVEAIIKGTNPSEFRVLSGEDHLVAKIMQMGGYGVISASANVAPRYFSEITEHALNGDYEKAFALQEEVNPFVKEVFAVKNPIPLAFMFNTGVRLPLVGIPDLRNHKELEEKIRGTLNKYTPQQLGINLSNYGLDFRV